MKTIKLNLPNELAEQIQRSNINIDDFILSAIRLKLSIMEHADDPVENCAGTCFILHKDANTDENANIQVF
ncbi:MAG: hypothetical protein RIS47_2089 [Bacteroidota bacterium]|jgi:hypothetical protein